MRPQRVSRRAVAYPARQVRSPCHRCVTGARAVSVGFVLLIGLPIDTLIALARYGSSALPLGCRIEHDARRRVLIPMGGVFDQRLLGQLEALGLASPSLVYSAARFATAQLELVDPIVGFVHAPTLPATAPKSPEPSAQRDSGISRVRVQQFRSISSEPPNPPASAPTVAIVGAGFAGCAAARLATALGFEVTLFDAMGRPGGRVESSSSDESSSPLELNGRLYGPSGQERLHKEMKTVFESWVEQARVVTNPLAPVDPLQHIPANTPGDVVYAITCSANLSPAGSPMPAHSSRRPHQMD